MLIVCPSLFFRRFGTLRYIIYERTQADQSKNIWFDPFPEWRCADGHFVLNDNDRDNPPSKDGWRRLNTLDHYGVPKSAVFAILPNNAKSFTLTSEFDYLPAFLSLRVKLKTFDCLVEELWLSAPYRERGHLEEGEFATLATPPSHVHDNPPPISEHRVPVFRNFRLLKPHVRVDRVDEHAAAVAQLAREPRAGRALLAPRPTRRHAPSPPPRQPVPRPRHSRDLPHQAPYYQR